MCNHAATILCESAWEKWSLNSHSRCRCDVSGVKFFRSFTNLGRAIFRGGARAFYTNFLRFGITRKSFSKVWKFVDRLATGCRRWSKMGICEWVAMNFCRRGGFEILKFSSRFDNFVLFLVGITRRIFVRRNSPLSCIWNIVYYLPKYVSSFLH